MSNGQIVEKIYKSGNFRGLCVKIAKHQDLADDLYSEFLKSLLEMAPEKLEEVSKQDYFNVFCVGIINNIWGMRDRVKTYKVGTTSPLYKYSSSFETVKTTYIVSSDGGKKKLGYEYYEEDKEVHDVIDVTEDYDFTIDYKSKDMEDILLNEWNNENRDKMFQARVFYYSYIEHKNPKQFSKKTGIPYYVVINAINRMKETLRKKLKTKIYD